MSDILNTFDPFFIAIIAAVLGGLFRWGVSVEPPVIETREGKTYTDDSSFWPSIVSAVAAGLVAWLANWAGETNGGLAILSLGLGFYGLSAALAALNINASNDNKLDAILAQLQQYNNQEKSEK